MMCCGNAMKGLGKLSDPHSMISMCCPHADELLLRLRSNPTWPETGGQTPWAKHWDELMSTDMEFPSSPSSSIWWPHPSSGEATLCGRLKRQFSPRARLALSTSPTQILPIVIIVMPSELLPVRKIGRKMTGGCNLMCLHHTHLISPPYFSLIPYERLPCYSCTFSGSDQGHEVSVNASRLHACTHTCVSAQGWVCTPITHTSAAQQEKLVLTPQTSHGSSFTWPVFADIMLSGRTNLVKRTSVNDIDLRRANSKRKSTHSPL